MATFEKLENSEVKYTITIDSESFDNGMSEAFIKTRKRYSIPGFRKGKAPRAMIERYYGEGVLYEATFDHLYWDAYISAVKESEETPLDRPSIEIEQIGKGQDLIFHATVPVRPELKVESSQYKGIEVERAEYNVSDADIMRDIEREREKLARFSEVDRAIADGDQVELDYAGTIDGVAFPGGTAEGQKLVIGSGRFIPGFEEQLLGLKKGDEKDLNLTFPEDYHAADLAGKDAIFQVKVVEIQVKELPDLDDEFAKDVSDFDTLEEYKADVRSKLEESAKNNSENVNRQRCIDVLIDTIKFEIPDVMVEQQIDYMLNDMQYRLSNQGITLEDYFAYMGLDMESARATLGGDADKKVRSDMILDAVGKAEEIEISDEEIDEEITTFAKSIDKTLEETKAMFRENDLLSIRSDLADRKALQLIMDAAVWTEAKEKPEDGEEADVENDEE